MPSPGRLNDSNDLPRGERQPARGLPHGDSRGVNTKLQQLVLCSSKSMNTSLLSIRRSLSTRMGGPWGRYRRTSSRSYGRCGTSAVSCARSGDTRMGSARIPLSAYKFCDARGTHVQVQVCPFVQTGIRTVPQNHLYQAHSGCTAIFVTCVTCVCPPTPHGRVLKCWCFWKRGNRGKKNKKGEYFFFKNKTKNAERLELTSRGLIRAKRVTNLRRWRKEHTKNRAPSPTAAQSLVNHILKTT